MGKLALVRAGLDTKLYILFVGLAQNARRADIKWPDRRQAAHLQGSGGDLELIGLGSITPGAIYASRRVMEGSTGLHGWPGACKGWPWPHSWLPRLSR